MPKDGPIHKAAYKGDAGTVEDLLDSKVDVNVKGAQNRSPLHRAGPLFVDKLEQICFFMACLHFGKSKTLWSSTITHIYIYVRVHIYAHTYITYILDDA